jgi:hypothetical protein
VEYAQKLLENIGLNGRRVQMLNVSAAMGGQFAFAAAEMTAEIKRIGPNPLKEPLMARGAAGGVPPSPSRHTRGMKITSS